MDSWDNLSGHSLKKNRFNTCNRCNLSTLPASLSSSAMDHSWLRAAGGGVKLLSNFPRPWYEHNREARKQPQGEKPDRTVSTCCPCTLNHVQPFVTPRTVAHQAPVCGILQARIPGWVAIPFPEDLPTHRYIKWDEINPRLVKGHPRSFCGPSTHPSPQPKKKEKRILHPHGSDDPNPPGPPVNLLQPRSLTSEPAPRAEVAVQHLPASPGWWASPGDHCPGSSHPGVAGKRKHSPAPRKAAFTGPTRGFPTLGNAGLHLLQHRDAKDSPWIRWERVMERSLPTTPSFRTWPLQPLHLWPAERGRPLLPSPRMSPRVEESLPLTQTYKLYICTHVVGCTKCRS